MRRIPLRRIGSVATRRSILLRSPRRRTLQPRVGFQPDLNETRSHGARSRAPHSIWADRIGHDELPETGLPETGLRRPDCGDRIAGDRIEIRPWVAKPTCVGLIDIMRSTIPSI